MKPHADRTALTWLLTGVLIVGALTWLRLSTGIATAFTSFDGTRIVYTVDGNGPTVVLLHAFMLNSHTNWQETGVAAALVDAGYRVVAVDARGHGNSQAPASRRRYADRAMARDVSALFDALDIERATLIGYSMGGGVAVQVATIDARVRGLVLGGISLGETEPWDASARAAEVAALRAANPPGNAFYRRLADELGGDRLAYAARLEGDEFPQFTVAEAGALRVPACFVNGREDADPAGLAAFIKRQKVLRVPGDHATAIWSPAFAPRVAQCVAFVAHES
ncbi:MAG: alpha/beta fold hydrolase [Pseudomonadota bacterium]